MDILGSYDHTRRNWGAKNSEGRTILESFTPQFFQNNSSLAYKMSKEDLGEIKYKRDSKGVTGFTTPETLPAFVRVTSKNGTDLYQKTGDDAYTKIPVLGNDKGISEYEYGALSTTLQAPLPKETAPVQENEVSFSINTGTAQDILSSVASFQFGSSSNANVIADALLPLIPDGLTIEVSDDIPGAGWYQDNQIKISRKLAESGNPKAIAETIVHEYAHALTSDNLTHWLNPDLTVKENAPAEFKALAKTYNSYYKQMKAKYEQTPAWAEYTRKLEVFKASKGSDSIQAEDFTEFERQVFYGAHNIKEFVAVALGNNQLFLKEASSFKGNNMLQEIAEKFREILNHILGKAGSENTLSQEALSNIFSFIEASTGKATNKGMDISDLLPQFTSSKIGEDLLPLSGPTQSQIDKIEIC